jgi:uncharacterized protein (TIGR02001 family)
LLAAIGNAAEAQVAFSAALDSDYRIRGVSFSDGRPTGSLTISLDHSSGLYAGATGVVGDTDHSGIRPLGYQANAGYAVRTAQGWSVDAGVSTAGFTQYLNRRELLTYSEIYAGVSAGSVSAHLYYSPDYLREHVQTLYGEVDAAVRIRPNLRLFGHLGLLAPLSGRDAAELNGPRYDLEAGVAADVKQLELRLAWSRAQSGARDLPAYFEGGDAVVASASVAF